MRYKGEGFSQCFPITRMNDQLTTSLLASSGTSSCQSGSSPNRWVREFWRIRLRNVELLADPLPDAASDISVVGLSQKLWMISNRRASAGIT